MKFILPKPKKVEKAIAVDFDGVIHDYKNPIEGRRMGRPMKGAREALRFLKTLGYEIIIFSIWGDEKGKKTISDFMIYYELPFDKITNIKPQAEYYIDDKGIKFTSWEDVVLQI